MERRIVERVEDWDSRPFSGGYEGLRELSSSDFSGAVQAGGTWLFMLNGRIVGLFDGSIETVEDAEGTAYGAPHQSLPLLYTMQANADEPRAKYYTNDTPISEVHQTLSSGSFTGYIELSENVLSGDYYQVYHGGRSMSAAFVGTSEQLITDEEAFERADDEVGIYEVYEVDLEITEIPEPESTGQPDAGAETPVQEAESNGDDTAATPRDNQPGAQPQDSNPGGARSGGLADENHGRDEPVQSREEQATGSRTGRSTDRGRSGPDDRSQSRSDERSQDRSDDRSRGRSDGRSRTNDRTDTERGTDRDRTGRDDGGTRGGSNRPDGQRDTRRESDQNRNGRREEPRRDDRRTGERDDRAGRAADRGSQGADRSRRNRPGRSGGNVDPDDRTEQPADRGRPRTDDKQERTDSRARRSPDRESSDPRDQQGKRPTEDQQGSRPSSENEVDDDPRLSTEGGSGRGAERPPSEGSDDSTTRQARTPSESSDPVDRADPDRSDTAPGGNNGAAESETGDPTNGAGEHPTAEASSGAAAGTVEGEAAWRDAETIPSLDPDRTGLPDDSDREKDGSTTATAAGESAPSEQSASTANDATPAPEPASAPGTEDVGTGTANGSSEPNGTSGSERAAEAGDGMNQPFDAEVLEREDQIDRLQQRVSNLEADREDLRAERDELARTVDRLRDEKEDLQAEIDHLESELIDLESEVERLQQSGGSADADVPASKRSITGPEALAGTDLFVRYASKSEATLDDMYSGDATPEDVNANLRLEHHTRFESDEVVVDGQPFDEWLTGTLEYRFVDWFVTHLPYEIRDTGHTDALKDLFDAFPNIDRAELEADISLQYEEDGEEIREQQTFDVVIRDRMGNPLVVANLNDSRDPASQEMMVDLKETADRVKETADSLGASFLVTKSFFAPGALETASEATSGGFLSRDSRESYVKLSRKNGYHLCLVEARGDDFHLNVPEL